MARNKRKQEQKIAGSLAKGHPPEFVEDRLHCDFWINVKQFRFALQIMQKHQVYHTCINPLYSLASSSWSSSTECRMDNSNFNEQASSPALAIVLTYKL